MPVPVSKAKRTGWPLILASTKILSSSARTGAKQTHSKAMANVAFKCSAHFFKNALNKSIGSGRNVVVLCSLAISRMVWR